MARVKTNEEADKRIAALRRQQEQENASKRAKSGDQGSAAGTRSGECPQSHGFAPPAELTSFQPTDLEDDLRRTLQGPSFAWHTNSHPAAKKHSAAPPQLPDEVQRRREAMQAIDTDPRLQAAATAKGPFGVFLRNRLRQLHEERPEDDLHPAMRTLALEAVSYGSPETADGAAVFLDERFGKAGHMSQDDAFVGRSSGP